MTVQTKVVDVRAIEGESTKKALDIPIGQYFFGKIESRFGLFVRTPCYIYLVEHVDQHWSLGNSCPIWVYNYTPVEVEILVIKNSVEQKRSV